MAEENLFLVFNRPPTGVSDDEFNRWAVAHFSEIVGLPGWASARRFRLEPETVPTTPIPFPFMSLYGLEGDTARAISAMQKGTYDLPQWFERAQGESCFAGWNCVPISDTVRAPS